VLQAATVALAAQLVPEQAGSLAVVLELEDLAAQAAQQEAEATPETLEISQLTPAKSMLLRAVASMP
jgi:hypothetical protein